MGRDTSLMITAKDNASSTMRTIQNATQLLTKDLGGLGEKLDYLNKTRFDVKTDLSQAKRELSDALKAFNKTTEGTEEYHDALNRLNEAQYNVDQLTSNLKTVGAAANQTQRDINALAAEQMKLENRAGTGGMPMIPEPGEGKNTIAALASAGLTKMIGGVVNNMVESAASSMLGDRGAQAFGNVLDSAVSGAAIGSAIAPGVGTVIGAISGAALGGITAAVNDFQIKDEVFKGVVQDLYTSAAEKIRETGLQGIELASMRERRFEEFTTIFGGEKNGGIEKATDFLGNLQDMANRTPFEFDTLTGLAKGLTPYFENADLEQVMMTLGNTGATLGLEMSELDYIAGSIGYMRETDKLLLQQLKPLQSRGIPVFDYLAKGMGVEKDVIFDMISKNEISGKLAADVILDSMGEQFKGGMEALAKTYSGRSATVEELWDNIGGAFGESYTEGSMPSLQREQMWLENKGYALNGAKMEEVDIESGGGQGMMQWMGAMGMAQADYDTTKSAVYRATMDAFMTGGTAGLEKELGYSLSEEQQNTLADYNKQHQSLIERSEAGDSLAGAELIGLMGAAEGWAATLFEDTDIAGAMKDANVDMVKGIQDAVVGSENTVKSITDMTTVLSQGILSTDTGLANIVDAVNGLEIDVTFDPFGQQRGVGPTGSKKSSSSAEGNTNGAFAIGLNRVPFDGFMAELHEGERVLTAQQARAMDDANSIGMLNAPPLAMLAEPLPAPHEFTDNTENVTDTASVSQTNIFNSSVHNTSGGDPGQPSTSGSGGGSKAGDVNINLNGNYNIREEADIQRVAQELVSELKLWGMVV